MTTATTENHHTGPKPKRGTRGRRDRPSRTRGREERGARHGWRRADTADDYAAAAELAEALAREASRVANRDAVETFERRYRARLLEEVGRVGTVDAAAFVLAHSRAALATWKGSGLHTHAAEEIRLRVLAEERRSLGVEAIRGALEVSTDGYLVAHAEEIRVPSGRALDGERPRRSGKR